jgi:uncharacterized protein (TIGR02145 family)
MKTKIETHWKGITLGIIQVVLINLIILIFIPSCEKDPFDDTSGTFTDSRDNHQYKWVKIGNQIWLAENLALLPTVSAPSVASASSPIYYVYEYSGADVPAAKATSNYQTYGVLYNWMAALTACPSGWHLPSDAEWTVLEDYLINNGYGFEGSGDDVAKSMAATTNWNNYPIPGTVGNDQASNNKSGFSAIPGGFYHSLTSFKDIGGGSHFWSSTVILNHAWYRDLFSSSDILARGSNIREIGFSVRCIKD